MKLLPIICQFTVCLLAVKQQLDREYAFPKQCIFLFRNSGRASMGYLNASDIVVWEEFHPLHYTC